VIRRGSTNFLDSRLIVDGEVVSLTRRSAALYPQENSWCSFLLEAESTPGPSMAGRTGSIKKSHDIGNRTRDLPACSVVPRPTTQPRTVHESGNGPKKRYKSYLYINVRYLHNTCQIKNIAFEWISLHLISIERTGFPTKFGYRIPDDGYSWNARIFHHRSISKPSQFIIHSHSEVVSQ
jgi:hypothetical protein